ncbi:ATP-dependent DNA helicase PIF1 [Tanacetum coccineum]
MLLQEGSIIFEGKYVLRKTMVSICNQLQLQVKFYSNTFLMKSLDFQGPVFGFHFVSFDDILNNEAGFDFSVDVIGHVVECGDINVFSRNGKESKQISLQLENVDGKKISCTLWDNHAQDFATFVSTGITEGFVIIIIQFGKVRLWNGNPTVQNALFGTRLFLNEDIEEINEFKRSLIVKKGVSTHSQMTTHLSSQTVYTLRDEFLTKYPRKYVDDIPDVTEKMVCVLLGTIKDIKKSIGGTTLRVVFYCNKCKTKVTSVVPRFRVNVRVQDATGTISLVLFDCEVYQMTDKHAFEIRKKQEKDGDVDSFPEVFNELINKKFIFKIEVSDFNIENGYDVYTVSKVCHDAEIMDAMIKRDAIGKDIVSETEIDQPSIGCLDSKDAVSCTGDSLAATDIDSNSATSPATKCLRDTFNKDILVCFQETSNTSSEVGIGVSSSCHDSLSNANNCTPNTKRVRQVRGSITPSWSMMNRVTKSAISTMNSMTGAKHVSNDISTPVGNSSSKFPNISSYTDNYSARNGKHKAKFIDPNEIPNFSLSFENGESYLHAVRISKGKVDSSVNKGRSPYVYRLQGQNYHLMGSLLPVAGSTPKFSQLYIYDTENEVSNPKNAIMSARDQTCSNDDAVDPQAFIGRREKDGRTNNLPSASEIVGIVIGDIDASFDKRDIVVETQSGLLQRISELLIITCNLNIPSLFPAGSQTATELVSNIEKALQQFLVDGYTMIESQRLSYIRNQQKKLRCDSYRNLTTAMSNGSTYASDIGKPIRLPSSFTGGSRYILHNYMDDMDICKWFGYPDLFITVTCNPEWPKITRFLNDKDLNPEDRPDILCRLFKMKLDQLIKDLKKDKLFGGVKAFEFQKRGLPHAHICIFLDAKDKFPSVGDIDRVICAEIPDKENDPQLFQLVSDFMIHGPCGVNNPTCPCMRDGKCSKRFPRDFVNHTSLDEDGYPIYRRRDNGYIVEKGGIALDNRYVVPYNSLLLKRYQAHINVEWCNQSGAIKYLFKYINKGPDRVTAAVYEGNKDDSVHGTEAGVDEIKEYYNCRYISACEATWRIFSFDIHYRYPSVERLSFHLPGEQNIFYEDDADLCDVLNKPTVGSSMFMAWMERNKVDAHALRGRTSHEDIRTVNGILYPSYKEACYALGLLDDDKEYVEAIEEASKWASAASLRSLFVWMLLSNTLSKPDFVWTVTWKYLSDDVLYKQRIILKKPDLQLEPEVVKNLALLIHDELAYDKDLLKVEHDKLLKCLTDEQKTVYESVMSAVKWVMEACFFYMDMVELDEAPMIHKHCFEALDRTLRDILRLSDPSNEEKLFGGKVVVFGGDFRQILPVIPKGSRHDIVNASLNSSYLWDHCRVLKLTVNMRLQVGSLNSDLDEIKEFGEWILKIGNGTESTDPVGSIISFVYPNVVQKLSDHTYFQDKAILAPTHEVVDVINDRVLSMIPEDETVYLSSDSICESDQATDTNAAMFSPDFLNSLKFFGLPNHKLILKVGVIIMLLRNIDQPNGLCNGTRLQVVRLDKHVIEAKIITGSDIGYTTLITRQKMNPSDKKIPFKVVRRQFPVDVCFAMTINKSQGQSLARVGLFLPRPVFTHGQLYVAVSRVKSKKGLKVLVCDNDGKLMSTTTNVVYKEVLHSL